MSSNRHSPLSSERGVFLSEEGWCAINFFVREEFLCRCCGEERIARELVLKLDDARRIAGIPMIVNSGYRCPKHNREVDGFATSSHLRGYAADISTPDHQTRFKIVRALVLAGFQRIIIYRDKRFVHVDVDPEKPQNIMPIV